MLPLTLYNFTKNILVIHCGDISYANKYRAGGDKLAWAKQEIWDTWGVMVEPITRKVPYMVSPGNHELDMYDSTMENNTIYSKRFIMPGCFSCLRYLVEKLMIKLSCTMFAQLRFVFKEMKDISLLPLEWFTLSLFLRTSQ